MSTDRVEINGLAARARHGASAGEHSQPFIVDLVFWLDAEPAAVADSLALTVDYREVAREAVEIVSGEPVRLIETLAEKIAARVLKHGQVTQVEVTVHQPQADLGVPFDDVSATLRRSRADVGEAVAVAPTTSRAVPVAVPEEAVAEEGVPEGDDGIEPDASATGQASLDPLAQSPATAVEVVLALGGSSGDVRAALRSAVRGLRALEGVEVTAVSPLARTVALLSDGSTARADQHNAVVLATTTLSPRALLAEVVRIEAAHGGGQGRAREDSEPTVLGIDLIDYNGMVVADDTIELPHPRAHERAGVLVPWSHVSPEAQVPGLGGGPVAVLAETAPDADGVRWLALDWFGADGTRSPSSP